MSEENTFDFYDDDNIRKDIIQKLDKEKKLEETIKCDLENLQRWFEIEHKVILEKEKILKKCYNEICAKKIAKKKELYELYGIKNFEKVSQKYNIRL